MNRTTLTALAVALVLLGAGAIFLLNRPNAAAASPTLCANRPKAVQINPQSITALKIEDAVVGTGAEAITGDTVEVHYIGRLADGKQFDTSCDRGQPFSFRLGAGQVIPGWDSGIVGMRVGGHRRLLIPANLAYGAASPSPDIPANSPLIFDVELLKVTKP
ncbi:MAG: peptidylprolyl isomerase [Meiothermus sp.]